MTQSSLPWQGRTTGHSGPYSAAQFRDFFSAAFTASTELEGVFYKSDGNNLNMDLDNVAKTVTIGPGSAIVNGAYYYNSANVLFEVASGTDRLDLVVLRWDLFSQTVTLDYILGTTAVSPTRPALTQTTSVWEIALYEVALDASGNLSYIDARVFPGRISSLFVPAGMGVVDYTGTQEVKLAGVDSGYGLDLEGAEDTVTTQVQALPDYWSTTVRITPYYLSTAFTGDIVITNSAELFSHLAPQLPAGATSGATTITPPAATGEITAFSSLQITTAAVHNLVNINLLFQRTGTDVSDTATETLYFVGWLLEADF